MFFWQDEQYRTIDGISWLHAEEAAGEVVYCLQRYLKDKMGNRDPHRAVVEDRLKYWRSEAGFARNELLKFGWTPKTKEVLMDRERLLKIAVEANLHLRKARDIERYKTLRAEYKKAKSFWEKYGLAKDFDKPQRKLKPETKDGEKKDTEDGKKKERSFEDFAHKRKIFQVDISFWDDEPNRTMDGVSWAHSGRAASEVLHCLQKYFTTMENKDQNKNKVRGRIKYWRSEEKHAQEKLKELRETKQAKKPAMGRARLLKIAVEATLHLRKARDTKKYTTLKAEYNRVKSDWEEYGLAEDFNISWLMLNYEGEERSFEEFAYECKIFAVSQ